MMEFDGFHGHICLRLVESLEPFSPGFLAMNRSEKTGRGRRKA